MKFLLSPQGRRELGDFLRKPALLAFDFDGTLAPIVRDPAKARLPSPSRNELERINAAWPVAVISGRGLEDLEKRLGFEPDFLIGNHGLEGLKSWRGQLLRLKRICASWRNQIENRAGEIPPGAGVFLENKTYSLSLHFRQSPVKTRARRLLLEIAQELRPVPRLIPGKDVLNLVPEGAPHKGSALMEIMDELGVERALYIGDDDTDEDIFALGDPRLLTVRVGRKGKSSAKYYVKNQAEVLELLREISGFSPALRRRPLKGRSSPRPSR